MHYRDNALPQRKTRDLLGVIGISIALLACVITAWGHGSPGDEGYEADHDRYIGFDIHHTHSTTSDADGNPKSDENNWHWHLNTDNVSHEDRTDGTGVYDSDGTHGEVHVEHEHEYINEEGDSHSNLHLHKNMNVDDSHHTFGRVNGEGHDGEVDEPWTPEPEPPMPEPETPEPEPPATSRPRSNPTPSTSAVIELPDPNEQPAPPADTSAIDKPVEEVVEAVPVELAYHEWTWLKGYNLVSFPVMREDIETVADLYQAYALFNAPQDIIYVAIDGCWFGYNGQEGQIAGDVRITPYLGVLIVMDWTAIVGMRGVEQIGDGEVELMPGLNVVGLSELPSRYRVPSDFLEVDGIEVVMTTGWDDEKYMSDLRLVGRAGDPGDDNPLYRGQAVLLIATTQLTLDLSSDTLAAPMAPRVGTLNTSWGAMKR